MPSNIQAYRQMADHASTQITGSHQSWMAFLEIAARLYKYPYNEQIIIHAQRPDATACAEFDFWNEKMGRYVRRGSKGIALIDTTGDRPKLKYVFDVSDTGGRENSRLVNLWELRHEHIRDRLNDPEAGRETDRMLAYAECIAAETAVEPDERFSVIETDTG